MKNTSSCVGVYLSLNGDRIDNNSYVDIDSIGSNETGALLCHTNRTGCCSGSISPNEPVEGSNWYYPNDTVVRMAMADNSTTDNVCTAAFNSNRGQDEILLFQNPGCYSARKTGRFRCVIPDDNDINQTLYVNICELHFCNIVHQ